MASNYFSDEELMCHGADQGDCDCGIESAQNVNPRLLELLDQLRENVGGPLSLSCAYRCEAHNSPVSFIVTFVKAASEPVTTGKADKVFKQLNRRKYR